MNYIRVFTFVLILSFLQVLTHTLVVLLFGEVSQVGSLLYFINIYSPNVIVSIAVLSWLAIKQTHKVYTHVSVVCILSALLIISINSVLIGEYIPSPFWYIDLGLSLVCIVISVQIGRCLIKSSGHLQHNKLLNKDKK